MYLNTNLEVPTRRRYTESDSGAVEINISGNVQPRPISRRQTAEIQLEALLKEDHSFWPSYIQHGTGTLPSGNIVSLEEIAKQLSTQAFIIERLVFALNLPSIADGNTLSLNSNIVQKLTRILGATMDVRCLVFFKMLDENRSEFIDRTEICRFYTSYLTQVPAFNKERIPQVIEVMTKKYRLDTNRTIDFDEFHSIIANDRILLGLFSQFSVSPVWFIKTDESKSPRNLIHRFFSGLARQGDVYDEQAKKLTVNYVKNNLPRIIAIILYIIINIGLTIYVIIYRAVVMKLNVFLVFARICGMLLNFNGSLVIALMLRQTILLIRTTQLHRFLPIDDHIDFHKFVGRFIGILSIIHTIAHICNFASRIQSSWTSFFFTVQSKLGWVKGFAPLSGVILCIVLLVMIICSMHWVRRGGYFQVFYWSHFLYVVFIVLLILHAGNFWKWAVGPIVLLVVEKTYSILTRFAAVHGRTFLLSATIEQSNVISLQIHRPKLFRFRPGDYILINLPRVALYEFHPFTISSSPEEMQRLDIHIQAVGNWTKLVYERFKRMSDQNSNEIDIQIHRADRTTLQSAAEGAIGSNTIVAVGNEENNVPSVTTESQRRPKEVVIVKGPYSTCARYIFNNKHVILIGSGIGITPYASILSSLMAQFRASRTICKHCNGFNYNDNGFWEDHRLEKVDFVWVSRDSKSFQWFLNLLHQFEREQQEYLTINRDERRFLDIQLYFTGMKTGDSIDNFFLQHVTNVWTEAMGTDVFTGLQSITRFGRPDWQALFTSLTSGDNSAFANDTSLFFCGPKTAGQIIKQHCASFDIRYYEEKF